MLVYQRQEKYFAFMGYFKIKFSLGASGHLLRKWPDRAIRLYLLSGHPPAAG
jgi:hypothetical protein